MTNLIVLVPAHNAEPYIEQCLASILDQVSGQDLPGGSPGARIVYLDDASTDRSIELARLKLAPPHTIVSFPGRAGALRGIIAGVRSIAAPTDDDVCVQVDGDDYLKPGALEAIARAFEAPECWVAYGRYERTDGRKWQSGAYPGGDFRVGRFMPVGVRAFRAKLALKIRDEDMQIGGWWQASSWDLALMLPMLEMAGLPRVRFIDRELSVYRIHQGCDGSTGKLFQDFSHWYSRQRPYYSCLSGLDEMPTQTPHATGDAVLFVPGQPSACAVPQSSLQIVPGRG